MSLYPRVTLGELDLTDAPYGIEFGFDMGSPQNVAVELVSRLQDGEVISSTRSSNREVQFSVIVEGSDMVELAEAERALILEADKPRNTLTLDPGDGYGAPTAFDTFRAQVRFVRDDSMEMANLRRYTVSIVCLPFGRSITKVRVDTVGAPTGGTVVNTMESTTGWSSAAGNVAPLIAVDSTQFYAAGTGAVKVKATSSSTSSGVGYYGQDVTYAGVSRDTLTGLAVDTGAGGYMSVLVRYEWPTTPDYVADLPPSAMRLIRYTVGATTYDPTFFASEAVPGIGTGGGTFVRYAWAVPAGVTVSEVEFLSYQYVRADLAPSFVPHVWYDSLTLSTGVSTSAAVLSTVDVLGSVRAPCALEVTGSGGLGEVWALTVDNGTQPTGFSPAIRQWLSAGTTTVDADAISGTSVELGGSFEGGPTFDVPLDLVAAGNYEVWLRVDAGSNAYFAARADLVIDSTVVGTSTESAGSYSTPVAGYRMASAGRLTLPPTAVENVGAGAYVRIRIKGGGALDLVLLRPVAAALTVVDCGTGSTGPAGASTRLWIDSPSLANPQGGWWRGTAADRVNARSAISTAKALGRHYLTPPQTRTYVLTTGSTGSAVVFEYFPTVHSNSVD